MIRRYITILFLVIIAFVIIYLFTISNDLDNQKNSVADNDWHNKIDVNQFMKLVLFVKWGDSEETVSYRTRDKNDPEVVYEIPIATNSFWVGDDNEIYLLDGGKIIKIYKNGTYKSSMPLLKGDFVYDFIVVSDGVIANTYHDIFKFDFDGNVINKRRIFGVAKPGNGIEKMVFLGNKIAIPSTGGIALDKVHFDVQYKCLDIENFNDINCDPYTELLKQEEIADSDGQFFISQNYELGVLKVSSLMNGILYNTSINTESYFELFDFMFVSPVRIKGQQIYFMVPENGGLSIKIYNHIKNLHQE